MSETKRFPLTDEQMKLFWEELNTLKQVDLDLAEFVRNLLQQQQQAKRNAWKAICQVVGIPEDEFSVGKNIFLDGKAKEIVIMEAEQQ